MLDEATGRVFIGDPAAPRFMYTARLDIRYRKNVPVGKPLKVVGRAGKSKRRTATTTGTIYDAEGDILAEAEALMVDVPEGIVDNVNLEDLGWKVYE